MTRLDQYPAAERLKFLQSAFRRSDSQFGLMCGIAEALGFRATKVWDVKNQCPVFVEINQEAA